MNDYDEPSCPFCRPFNWLKRLWQRCRGWKARREARRASALDFGLLDETLAAIFRSEPYKERLAAEVKRAGELIKAFFPKPERKKRNWWCFIHRKTAK